MQVYSIDGKLCAKEQAQIPVTDHGLLYGDGVFEGFRFYNKRVLKAAAHLQRLADSARALALPIPSSIEDIRKDLATAVDASPYDNGYVRLLVTRGQGPLGIDPRQCQAGRVIMIVDQLDMVSAHVRDEGARLIISSVRSLAVDQMDPRVKSLNYLSQIHARMEASAAGADEAIVLNQSGHVAEGSADNVFVVKNNVLLTPPVIDGALPGITRDIVLELASKLHLDARITAMTPFDLYTADECFLTGTGAGLIPVAEVTGRSIPQCPGAVFQAIQAAFNDYLLTEDAYR